MWARSHGAKKNAMISGRSADDLRLLHIPLGWKVASEATASDLLQDLRVTWGARGSLALVRLRRARRFHKVCKNFANAKTIVAV